MKATRLATKWIIHDADMEVFFILLSATLVVMLIVQLKNKLLTKTPT